MSRRPIGIGFSASVLALLCIGLAGCRNPSGVDSAMLSEQEMAGLQRIVPLSLEPMPADESDAVIPALDAAPPAEQLQLTLEECRATALRNNLDLRVELITPTLANEAVREAEARFEPSLFGNASYVRTETPTSTALDSSQSKYVAADVGINIPLRTGGRITLDLPVSRSETNNAFATLNPSYTSDFAVSMSQPLLRDGGVRANMHAIRIARYQSQIVQARTRLEVMYVIAAVDRAYWRLRAARRALQLRKNEYDLAVAQFQKAQRMVSAGVLPEVEVIRAQAGVAERVEGVIIADNELRDRERELKRVLNKRGLGVRSPTAVVPGTEPLAVQYRLDPDRLTEAALKNRMEMLELELQIAQDASTIDFNRTQALPVLALDYTYNVNGLGAAMHDSFDLLLDRRFDDHRVGLQFVLPLGNRAAKSRLRQAMFTKSQRLATRESRRLEIQAEVAGALDQLEANWQRILASRHSAALAKRNLEAEERQFALGLRTSTDVLDTQTRLADAELAEIRAEVEYQIAKVDLAFATGTLLGEAAVEWAPLVPDTD